MRITATLTMAAAKPMPVATSWRWQHFIVTFHKEKIHEKALAWRSIVRDAMFECCERGLAKELRACCLSAEHCLVAAGRC
jgi:hypothetical protein